MTASNWQGGLEYKPSKDVYFIALAYLISQRSIDTNTTCGAVLVANDGRVLSTGYNGPPKGAVDEKTPMVRPDKYFVMLHAEENALLSYFGSAQDLVGSTMYITGSPCSRCLRDMIQKGIKRIVYAKTGLAKMMKMDPKEEECRDFLLLGQDIEIIEFDDMDSVKALLHRTVDAIDYKLSGEDRT